jgi:hypothetical protein
MKDVVIFFPDGIWVYPKTERPFKFNGSVIEFMSILVYHTELPIDFESVEILVRASDTLDAM